MNSIASTIWRRGITAGAPRRRGGSNRSATSSHCSSERAIANAMPAVCRAAVTAQASQQADPNGRIRPQALSRRHRPRPSPPCACSCANRRSDGSLERIGASMAVIFLQCDAGSVEPSTAQGLLAGFPVDAGESQGITFLDEDFRLCTVISGVGQTVIASQSIFSQAGRHGPRIVSRPSIPSGHGGRGPGPRGTAGPKCPRWTRAPRHSPCAARSLGRVGAVRVGSAPPWRRPADA